MNDVTIEGMKTIFQQEAVGKIIHGQVRVHMDTLKESMDKFPEVSGAFAKIVHDALMRENDKEELYCMITSAFLMMLKALDVSNSIGKEEIPHSF